MPSPPQATPVRTTAEPPTMTAQHVLEAVRALAPTIADRAAETESGRRVPRDLLDQLVGAGCFRMLLPPSHGGAGAALPDAMRVYEELSRADASVGWTVMIGSGSWCDLVGLPRATFDSLFPGDADVIIGGTLSPSGSVVPVDGGYEVSGRWGFASGCEHATWLFGNCVEEVGGDYRLRTVVFAPADVRIEDTWKVSGLCGTGSHHFTADAVFVPADRTFPMLEAEPCVDEPVTRIPPPALYAQPIAGAALGVARGAMADIRALAADKVPLLAPARLAANPLFQHQLATADTELRAASALLYGEADSTWATAVTGSPFTLEQRARIRSTAVWATARAVGIVDFAYQAGGGSALYADNPLQRRLRDVHAITQHFLVRPDTLTTAGAVLAGQDIDAPIF
jgi:alkylation response protein AidB-like acyl-CoA dehydrogenase